MKGDYCENTDFGIDDIAFYDKDGNLLFKKTTAPLRSPDDTMGAQTNP